MVEVTLLWIIYICLTIERLDIMEESTCKEGIGERIGWLDVLKGILILFVMLSHNYPADIYRRFFTPFFLTTFFFVSGYTFSEKESFCRFVHNRVNRLLQPFFVLGVIRIGLAYLINREENKYVQQYIIGFILQRNCEYDEMWFVSCLFTCSFLFYGLRHLSRKLSSTYQYGILLCISVLFMLFGMADMCIYKIKYLWEFEIACMMVFYMALGCVYKEYQYVIESKMECASLVTVFIIIYVISVFAIENQVDIHAEQFAYPILFIVMSIIVLIPALYLVKRIHMSYWNRILGFMGRNTLFYYAFSGIIRVVLYTVLERVGIYDEYVVPVMCTFLSAIVLAFPAQYVKENMPWAVGGK